MPCFIRGFVPLCLLSLSRLTPSLPGFLSSFVFRVLITHPTLLYSAYTAVRSIRIAQRCPVSFIAFIVIPSFYHAIFFSVTLALTRKPIGPLRPAYHFPLRTFACFFFRTGYPRGKAPWMIGLEPLRISTRQAKWGGGNDMQVQESNWSPCVGNEFYIYLGRVFLFLFFFLVECFSMLL